VPLEPANADSTQPLIRMDNPRLLNLHGLLI